MQNVMIPTDLSIRSLSYLHHLATQTEGPVRITLMHALRLPDSLLDCWPFSRSHRYVSVPDDFREACEVMKNRYAQAFSQINVEFFYGTTAPALRNFIRAHEIDRIAVPDQLHYHHAGENSYNPESLFRHTKLPVSTLRLTAPRQVVTAPASISALLGVQV